MATYRHWSVSLWRDPDDVPHCRILSPDKTEWRLISATLCGWRRCFVADELWFMTRIREEEDCSHVCLYVRLFASNLHHLTAACLINVFYWVNPLMGTLKLQSNGPLYSNTVIGTLAVDGRAVTFGTVRRGLSGLLPRPVPSSLYQM